MWESVVAGWAFVTVAAMSLWGMFFLGLFVLWLVHEECQGWSIFWLGLLGFIAYHATGISLTTAAIYAVVYIPIGIVWSMYRWKRFCSTKVEENNDYVDMIEASGTTPSPMEEDRRKAALQVTLSPTSNITRCVHWIMAWPFSAIENVLGDLYDMIVTLVKTYLINVYASIAGNALKNAK